MINDSKTISDTVLEWEKNAEARHKQIVSKIDISFHKVLIPTLLKLAGDIQDKRIIDVGCGSGTLSAELAVRGREVVGVDPSKEMIQIARREYGSIPLLKFFCKTVENFASSYPNRKFDIAASNMSLVTISNLEGAVKAVSSLLYPKGRFVFNITHPCFWNSYRRYEAPETFDYRTPHAQRGIFTISLDPIGLPSPTTHFHRPLEEYFQSLKRASLVVEELLEPFPSKEDEKLYPNPWKVPRFLSFRCIKIH